MDIYSPGFCGPDCCSWYRYCFYSLWEGRPQKCIVLMDCFGKNLGKQFDCQSLWWHLDVGSGKRPTARRSANRSKNRESTWIKRCIKCEKMLHKRGDMSFLSVPCFVDHNFHCSKISKVMFQMPCKYFPQNVQPVWPFEMHFTAFNQL